MLLTPINGYPDKLQLDKPTKKQKKKIFRIYLYAFVLFNWIRMLFSVSQCKTISARSVITEI